MRAKQLDILIFLYAILLIGLAIYAYLGPKHHMMSFIGGLVSGLLEVGFLAYSKTNPRVGRIACAAIALALFFMFLGAMASVGVAWNGLVGSISSLIVVVALMAGHFSAMKERKSNPAA